MEQREPVTIGLIGLGAMGTAIGERLRATGHGLVVHNRTRDVAARFAEAHGATVSTSPRRLAGTVDVVLTCVADATALHEVCTGEDGLLAGLGPNSLVIDTGTTGPAVTDRLAPRVREARADLLECPVAGTPGRARQGALVLMTGGDPTAHERALPVLSCLGSPLHVGPLGTATPLKLAVNLVLFGLNQVTLEALAVVRAGGVDVELFLRALDGSPAGAAIHDVLAPQYHDSTRRLGVGTYRTVAKDIELLREIVGEPFGELPVAEELRRRAAALVADGHEHMELGAAHLGASMPEPTRSQSDDEGDAT